MKVNGVCALIIFVATLSCSDKESPRVSHIPVKYEVDLNHPMTPNQEQKLREAAGAQLPEGVTIEQVYLAEETDGQTAMVFWMHLPESSNEKVKVSYFDKNEFSWSIREE